MNLNIGEYIDEDDFCRGYGAETNDGVDENFGYFEEEDEDNRDIDKAPEMPQHFYKEVENFLTRAPPKLDSSTKKIKGLCGKTPGSSAPILPDIYARQAFAPSDGPPKPPQAQSKVREKLMNSTSKQKKQSSDLDHNLLREAFAYTDRLLKEAIIEEASMQGGGYQEENPQPQRQPSIVKSQSKKANSTAQSRAQPSRTAPVESIYMAPHNDGYQARKKADSAGSSRAGPKGAVKKLRAKIPSESAVAYGGNEAAEAGFNIGNEADAGSNRRNPINFDELISNFQGGITLQKLRQELEQSKQSMKNSENFMKQLSKEYLSGGRL